MADIKTKTNVQSNISNISSYPPVKEVCPTCKGVTGNSSYDCPTCRGWGSVPTEFGNEILDLISHNR